MDRFDPPIDRRAEAIERIYDRLTDTEIADFIRDDHPDLLDDLAEKKYENERE